MTNFERYGLFAGYSFELKGSALKSMHQVVEGLRGIEVAIHQAGEAINHSGIVQGFRQMGRQASDAVGGAAQQFDRLRRQSTRAESQIQGIAAEFRALRSESRNIDFGNLTDVQQFRRASREIEQYVQRLKELEAQVDRTTPQGRVLAADLQRQQTIAQSRIGIAEQQRNAAIAQERQGAAMGVVAAGTAVMLPLVGIGKQAIQITADFNDQMQQIRAVSDLTADQLQQVRDTAKRLGATTRFSASDAASGFVLLAQAGYAVEDQLRAIEGTLNLAAAGNLDLANATEITVSTLGQFQLGADQATHAANVLAKAAAMGQIDVSDIGMSLKYAGVSAKRAGLSLEQTSTMLALLSEGGLKGEMAGTALGQMLDGLVAPASTGAAALKELGVITTDASGQLLPYEKILGQTIRALSRVSNESERAALQNKIFGTVGGRAAGVLMPRFEKLASTTAEIIATADKGIGAASEQARTMESDIGGSFRNLSSAMEGVFIEVGEVLVPIVKAATDAISNVLTAFISLPKPIKTVIVLAGVAAAAIASLAVVGGTAAIAFFGFRAALAEAKIGMLALQASGIPLTGFFARVMGAFSGGGIITGFQALGTTVAGLGTTVGGVTTALMTLLTGPIGMGVAAFTTLLAIVQFLNPKLNVLGALFSTIAAPIGFVFGLIKGVFEGIWSALKPLRDELTPLGSAFNPLGSAIQYIGNAVQQAIKTFGRFASVGESVGKVIGGTIGGIVTGPMVLLIRTVKTVIGAFTAAATQIRSAWQGFIDWFLGMPLVRFAMTLGQGLINALNHNPTVVIPQAWEAAVLTIRGLLDGLLSFGQTIGSGLALLLDPGKLFSNLVTGLLDKVKQLVQGLQESGIGNLFGGMLDGLDLFITKLSGLAGVPVEVQPIVQERPQVMAGAIPQDKPPVFLGKVRQAWGDARAASPSLSTPVPHPTPVPIASPAPAIANSLADSLQAITATSIAGFRDAFDQLTAEWRDRWAFLQRTGATDLAGLFKPGIESLRQSLAALRDDFGSFLGETAQAIVQLDFQRAKGAALDFGGTLLGTIQQASTAMGGLLLSAVTFGTFSLVSLSPMVLAIGAIVLGAAAIATNFLGIRTILFGIVQIIRGAIEVVQGIVQGVAAVLKMVQRVGQAISQVLGGILPALRGDFSQIQAGFTGVVGAVQTGALEINQAMSRSIQGVERIFQGFGMIGRGVMQGLRQSVELTGSAIRFAFQAGQVSLKLLGKSVILAQQGFRILIALPGQLQAQWERLRTAITASPLVANLSRLQQLPEQVVAIAQTTRQRWEALVSGVRFLIDASGIQGLPERIESIAQTTRQRWEILTNGIRFLIDTSGIQGLPERIESIAQTTRQRWEALVSGVRFLIDTSGIQSLPERVSAIAQTARQQWNGILEGIRFVIDLAGLEALPGRIRTVFQQADQIVTGAIAALRQIPITLNLAELASLPERVSGWFSEVAQRWRSTVEAIDNQPVLREFVAFVQQLPQIFSAAVERIQAIWSGLSNTVGGFLGKLRGKAQATGQQLVSDLAENSPGPTYQIRTRWAIAVQQIEGHLNQLVTTAQATGQRLTRSLSTQTFGEKTRNSINAVGNSFSSLGIVLSNFSPQLAGPLFLVGDLASSFDTLSHSLPQTKELLGQLAPRLKGIGSAAIGATQAIAGNLGGVLLRIVPLIMTGLGGAFSALGVIAATAWTAILAPALPFIAAAGAVVGAIALVKMAFRRNFLGIRTFAENVGNSIRAIAAMIGRLFSPVITAINQVQRAWDGFWKTIGDTLGFLPNLAAQAGNAIIGFLNHNPTVVIPAAWEVATERIGGLINGTVETAEQAGQQIASTLTTPPPIEPTANLSPLTNLVEEAKTRTTGFLDSARQSIQNVTDALRSTTVTMSLLGVTSTVSLLPIIGILAGVALGALAIATNFLGIRTILSGLIRMIMGIGTIVVSVARGIIQTIQGIVQILRSIPAVIMGDFSSIAAGWQTITIGIHNATAEMFQGIQAVVEGSVSVIRGSFEGLGQIIRFDVFAGITQTIQTFAQQASALVESFVSRASALLQKPVHAARSLVNVLKQGRQHVADAPRAIATATQESPVGMAIANAGQRYRDAQGLRQFDQRLNLAGVEEDLKNVQRQSRATYQTVSAGVSSVGVALSNFAPAAAAPLFVILDLIDAFQGIRAIIPAIKAAIVGNATATVAANATTTASNAMTATSYGAVQFAAIRAAIAQGLGIAAAKTVAAWSGIVAAANFLMAGGFGAIAVAAKAAWTAILAPIMPIILAITGIIGVVKLLFLAFRQNFGGIQDIVGQVYSQVQVFISEIRGAVGSVVDAFIGIYRSVDEAGKPIRELIMMLSGGLLMGAFQIALIPLRIMVAVITVIFKILGGIIRLIAAVLTPAIKVLALPFKLIGAIAQGLINLIKGIGSSLQSIGRSIWDSFPEPIKWMIGALQSGANFIFSGSPEPQRPQRFSAGGLVTGPSGGDVIPALLTNREFVVTPQATSQNLGLLEAMNAGVPVQQILSSLVTATPTGQHGTFEATGLTAQPIAPPVPILPSQGGAIITPSQPITVQVTVQNITIQGGDTVAAQATAVRLQDEILDAMEDPRFQIRVREALRDLTERMR